MFGRRKGETIDAGAELERAEQERIEGERGSSDLGSQRRQLPPGSRLFLLVVLIAVAALGITLTIRALSVMDNAEEEEETRRSTVRQVIPELTPQPIQQPPEPEPEAEERAEPITPETASPAEPEVVYRDSASQEPSEEDLIRERMLTSGLTAGSAGGGSSSLERPEQGADAQDGGLLGQGNQGELAEQLQPMRLTGSSAAVLPNPDLMITQGTNIDCVLETRMITTQPGPVACYTTRDIYSTSGRVVLIERGSKVTGHYQGGINQGQARIFVVWSRVETPEHVVINLDSPGTGPLGEGGLGGYVDTHFWERFGGAIMISLIGDLGEWASSQGTGRQGNNSIQFRNTTDGAEQAATEALRNSINIPPTLYKNQGERVSISIMRDLDFSDVYSLRTATGASANPKSLYPTK